MPLNYKMLGLRIKKARVENGYSQKQLADMISVSRKHLGLIEVGQQALGPDLLVAIANVLGISADDLLVDSLKHSSSTADTELHKLLLECNEKEAAILVAMVKYMQPILVSEGI